MIYNRVVLWKQGLHQRTEDCRVYKFFWARLASVGQLGLISDPKSSKLQNGINDPKGLENKIYTIMKGRETFYGDHTVQITNCSKVVEFFQPKMLEIHAFIFTCSFLILLYLTQSLLLGVLSLTYKKRLKEKEKK